MLTGMPRFVVLRHETPPGYPRESHFDLMFERGEALWTLAALQLPVHGEPVVADELFEHRLAYLDYEGDVSAGRGSVRRVDAGDYGQQGTGDGERGTGEIVLEISGSVLRGVLRLTPLASTDGVQRWRVELGSA
jgi:hypothetical protein